MDSKKDFIKQMEKVSKDLQYIEKGVKKNEKMLKRQLKPNDVANLVLYLSSDVSSGCTKQNFIVDAGIT